MAPTVFVDVKPDARIFQEEIFGPVVAITPFDTDEEALELANNTKYGLAAYVWTSDLKRAHNFAQNVEAGMVWLNSNNVRDLRTPFGGVKASGLGHEGGYRSIDFYTDQQAVHINLGEVHNPVFGKQAQPRVRQAGRRRRKDGRLSVPPPPPTRYHPREGHIMTNPADRTMTSSGFYVSQEAPITTDNPVKTPSVPAPDILRCAYMEIVVTDLKRSRDFYVDVLGLTVTEEDGDTVYLRSLEEFIHHNLVLRQGPVAAVAAFSYRVRSPEELDKAVAFYEELGCPA